MAATGRRRLAELIARDLFTCGGTNEHAGRLVLEPRGKRIDGGLGGWSEKPVADRIEDWLTRDAARKPVRNPRRR